MAKQKLAKKPRKQNKQKSTQKTKEREKKKMIWLGSQRLMEKPAKGTKKEKERQLILLTARVLGVSPFGINILGSLPYINKLGLSQKAKAYEPQVRFHYKWINYALEDNDRAVCKCKLVSGNNKELTDWIVGECSPSSMKMGTLKGYQNHMAQTRAKNRAILEAFGVQIHEQIMENIEILHQSKLVTENQKEDMAVQIGQVVSTSAEEIQLNEEKKPKQNITGQLEGLKKLAREQGAELGKEKEFLEEKIGHTVNFDNSVTTRYVSLIKTQFLNAVVKNNHD